MGIRVTLVYSPAPRVVREIALELPDGCIISQALMTSAIKSLAPEVDLQQALIGVWGRRAKPNQVLRDLDRLEIYRPLEVNPKVARRVRFAKQGARTTGLFATRRAGAKTGY